MRSLFALFVLIAICAAAQADSFERCVVSRCAPEVHACSLDAKCIHAADCLARCPSAHASDCSRSCAVLAGLNPAYANLTACTSQCSPASIADVMSLALSSPVVQADKAMAGCSAMKKVMCATAIAGAIVACGGPEDVPCILAALSAMEGCVTCFCESKGCPGLCKHVC